MNQLLYFRINEAIGNDFLITFVVKHGFHALERQIRFTVSAHNQTRLDRFVRNIVVAVHACDFFNQIFFNFHIETPARRNGFPLAFAFRHLTAQATQNVAHLLISNVMADQTIQFATAQGNGRALRQCRFICDIDNRTGFTAADVNQQTGRTLHRFVLQRRIDATLITVRGIGMQTMTARATGNRQRIEEGALQQYVLRFIVHTRMFATKDAAHGQRFMMIRNHQRIRVQLRFCAIKQHQRFALFRHANDNPAFNAVFIKGVHWLTQFEQHIVGHIHYRINGTNTAATQFFFHPQRGWRFYVDTFHHAAQITRTGVSGFHRNRQNIANGSRDWRDFRLNQRCLIQHRHITGDADNP